MTLSLQCRAQHFELKIAGENNLDEKIIDSIPYLKKHKTVKSITDEIQLFSKKLSTKGYIDNKITSNDHINDSLYIIRFNLKKKINFIHIYIDKENTILKTVFPNIKEDTLIIPYEEIESLLNTKLNQLEQLGYSFTNLKLTNIQYKKNTLYANLDFKNKKKREINSIILNLTQNNQSNFFPKGHLKQLNKKYNNKTFNQESIKQLYQDINNYEFVSQTKYPEILFTNDSTKIYTYIEKRKANTFDGYIGFTNSESKKVTFNGYLDITLLNTLHAGEKFSLYWKSDGSQQKTFNTSLEVPYIFKTPLGIKAQLNIFKQDSTFQNSKTAINLGYYINYNSKIYLGYQSTESSDIQNTNNSTISDYKNSYTTINYNYKRTNYNNNLFPEKAHINYIVGYGKRNTNNEPETTKNSKQFYSSFNINYNFKLNEKNYININSQNFILKSDNYIINELLRFGGINSIRGFSENSLQANFNCLILTEYRYLVSQNLYINSIADYGIYQDLTNNINQKEIKKLIGIGIGVTIQTTNGLLKIATTNGSSKTQNLQLNNTIINISYNVKF